MGDRPVFMHCLKIRVVGPWWAPQSNDLIMQWLRSWYRLHLEGCFSACRYSMSGEQGSHVEGQCLHKLHLATGDVHLWWLFPEDVSANLFLRSISRKACLEAFPSLPTPYSVLQDLCVACYLSIHCAM